MKLFDETQDVGSEAASYTEPNFVFLNRTSREEFVRIRDLLEVWFERYPSTEKSEFRSRFRSSNNFQHQGAFLELFLHELLLRLGCKLELHPSLDKTTKSPDFLVEPQASQKFYLEATVATGETVNETAARARENTVYEVLNRLVESPDYFLSLSVRGSPESPPPARKLANYINRELGFLEYDEIARIYKLDDLQNLPRWYFDHGGWHIEIQPIPKFKLRGNRGVRPIGSRSTGIRMVDNWTPIRDSIIEKGKKYGELDMPYVIAVNALEYVDTIDILQALYGQEEYLINISDNSEASEPRLHRKPNGVWVGPNGPQYTRISAVLMVTRLSTFNIPRADLHLYHNPWAQKPYESVLMQLHQAVPIDGKIHWMDGKNADTIFDLSPTWPDNAA
ncbi:MAG: hypothetical protein M1281_01700 [Chloroflexi bacterium]|nr:hypothetical protein [Chloroflexota bacterium]